VQAFSNKLAGCKPAEEMNTEEFVYPVTFEVDTKAKTFVIAKTGAAKEETKVETTETVETTTASSKCKVCPYIIGAAVIVAVAIALVLL
jgi:hypothetical protein